MSESDFSRDEALVQALLCSESPWEDLEAAEETPQTGQEPLKMEQSRYHRLVAHAVVSQRKARDLARRNMAVQSIIAVFLASISPLLTFTYIQKIPFGELRQIYRDVVSIHPEETSIAAGETANSSKEQFAHEQDLIDQLMSCRQKLVRSLPVVATAHASGISM